jgi:hypothetical protein
LFAQTPHMPPKRHPNATRLADERRGPSPPSRRPQITS